MKTPIFDCEVSVRDGDGLLDLHRMEVSATDGEVRFTDPDCVGCTVAQVLERASSIRVPREEGWRWESPTEDNFRAVLTYYKERHARTVSLHRRRSSLE